MLHKTVQLRTEIKVFQLTKDWIESKLLDDVESYNVQEKNIKLDLEKK